MITYTKMTQSHVGQIALLEKHCFSDPWSEKSVSGELHNPLSLWLVAMDAERVVGYIGSQTVMDCADIMNLAVDPEYRRMGIAATLLNSLCDMLREKGVLSVALEVRVSNAPAIALYEKFGFEPVGRRPNYYLNPKEDAWILRKELSV